MSNLGHVIHFIFLAYTLMLFARIMGAWFPSFQQFSVMRFINFYTEPYLKVFRRLIPPVGMIDLSPLLAFLALRVVEKILFSVLQ